MALVQKEVKKVYIWSTQVRPSWWKRPTWVLWWYWKLDWDMTDSSWCWHNGTWTANYVTWHKAWTQAYNASSTSYYVSVANSSDLYPTSWENFSVAFWIKPAYASWTAATYWPISMTRNIDSYTWWSMHNDSGSRNWQFRTRKSWWSTQSTQLSSLTWSANEWFHFTLTYDGTTVKYYKNWTLLNSFTRTFWDCSTTYPLTIWYASTWSATANAAMQEVMVMKNYCLSQDEINMIYTLT